MSRVIATFYNFGESSANKGRVRLLESISTSTPAYTPTVVSGFNITNTDPIAFYFNGGDSTGIRVLLVERRYNSSFVQIFCFLSVYDPSTWTQTVAPNLTTAYKYSDNADLLNIYSITSPASPAGTLYGADYSAGRVFKLVHGKTGSTETLTLASDYYQFAATVSGASVYSVDTALIGSEVYAVAQQYTVSPAGSSNPADYSYSPSIIVKLNASNLTVATGGPSASLAPNIFDIQVYDGNLYATALGGPQWYGDPYPPVSPDTKNDVKWNVASRIQKVTTGLAVTDLVRPSTILEASTDDMFDIRALSILSSTEAYILTGSYYTADVIDHGTYTEYVYRLNGRLWKVSTSALLGASNSLISTLAGTPVEELVEASGFMWALLPAAGLSKVWGMFGDNLGVYDGSGVSGSAIDAATASQWSTGSPAFNAISLAIPSVTKLKAAAAPSSIKSVRGYVHPLLASRAGVRPEELAAFVNAHIAK